MCFNSNQIISKLMALSDGMVGLTDSDLIGVANC